MKYFFYLLSGLFLLACHDNSPQPSDLVGQYTVSVKLKDKALDRQAIKDSIARAMEKATSEIEKAKEELSQELDLSDIDTSTLEGKLEYMGKSLGGNLGNLGLDLGKNLGGIIGDITESSLNLSEQILRNLKIKVELQADGDLKTQNKLINFGMDNAKWKVENGEFIVLKENGRDEDRFKIVERSKSGFTLEKDKALFEFVKSNEDQSKE